MNVIYVNLEANMGMNDIFHSSNVRMIFFNLHIFNI
jgi:hypothetical protein